MWERLRVPFKIVSEGKKIPLNFLAAEVQSHQLSNFSEALAPILDLPPVKLEYLDDPEQAIRQMVAKDKRLQLLKQVVNPEWYVECDIKKGAQFRRATCFYFDSVGHVLAKVDLSTGIIFFGVSIPLTRVVPMEGRKPQSIVDLYAQQSELTALPPVIVQQDLENRFLMINGHHRRLAALQQGLTHVAAWVICVDAQGIKLKIPRSREEMDLYWAPGFGGKNYEDVNVGRRLREALR